MHLGMSGRFTVARQDAGTPRVLGDYSYDTGSHPAHDHVVLTVEGGVTVTYNDPPHRFEAGTPPIVNAIGLGAAIDYVEGLGRDAIAAHEADLAAYAHERLAGLNFIRIFGHAAGKGAIISFEMQGAHAHDVATIIDREGVAVRAGTHCAQPLLARYGVTSTCRAS